MFDLSRMTRLLTLALASCAVTWALAAGAFAAPAGSDTTTTAAPAFKDVAGDADAAPGIATRAPAFKDVAGDTAKAPDPVQVQRVLDGIDGGQTGPTIATGSTNDAEWIALGLSIAAILTALGAVTLTVHRPRGRTLGV